MHIRKVTTPAMAVDENPLATLLDSLLAWAVSPLLFGKDMIDAKTADEEEE